MLKATFTNMKKYIILITVAAAALMSGCDKKAESKAEAEVQSSKADLAKISETAKTQIRNAIKKIEALPADYRAFVDKNLNYDEIKKKIDDAKSMDLGDAPEDFKKAYGKTVNSVEKLAEKAKNIPKADGKSIAESLKNLSESSGEDLKKWGDEIKAAFDEFKSSSKELYDSAKNYISN